MSEFDPNTTEYDYLIGVKHGGGQRPYGDTNHYVEITFSGKNISTKKNEGDYLIVGSGGMKSEHGKERAKEFCKLMVRGFKEKDDPTRDWASAYLKSVEKKNESETEVTWVLHIVEPYLD